MEQHLAKLERLFYKCSICERVNKLEGVQLIHEAELSSFLAEISDNVIDGWTDRKSVV